LNLLNNLSGIEIASPRALPGSDKAFGSNPRGFEHHEQRRRDEIDFPG
jgi:hypothetical protein